MRDKTYKPSTNWWPENAKSLTIERLSAPMTVLWDYRVWTLWDVRPRDDGRITLAIHREIGEPHPWENDRGDVAMSFRSSIYVDHMKVPRSTRMPLCSCHGYPWPCQAVSEERQAVEQMRRDADFAARAGDGQCASCGEVITSRQGKVIAPEPNVRIPGFGPPMFHTRLACRGGLTSYDESRRAALGASWEPLLPDEEPLPTLTASEEQP